MVAHAVHPSGQAHGLAGLGLPRRPAKSACDRRGWRPAPAPLFAGAACPCPLFFLGGAIGWLWHGGGSFFLSGNSGFGAPALTDFSTDLTLVNYSARRPRGPLAMAAKAA